MRLHKIIVPVTVIICLLIVHHPSKAQQSTNTVKVVGAMKNVMWKGQLYGTIDLDTISNKKHLYGLGPLEYLTGELMIINGKSYLSSVVNDTTINVLRTFKAKAPFFVYANVGRWKRQDVPDSIQTIQQLESFLDHQTRTSPRPFAFRLTGIMDTATIHIVNLPKGSTVSSPEDAHRGQTNFSLNNEAVEIAGFFSTEHQTIFTHHDTYLHMHLITKDQSKMGHFDEGRFKPGTMKLYLPVE
jgi:acetolactate decarboxylase